MPAPSSGGSVSKVIADSSDSNRKPCAMVPPNGVSRAARSGSTWMNWWSSVASANWSIIVCETTRQGETPTSLPTRGQQLVPAMIVFHVRIP